MKKKISLLVVVALAGTFVLPVKATDVEYCELKYNEAGEIINLREYNECVLKHSISQKSFDYDGWKD